MEKEALFKNCFRKYADDPKLPLFRHLFDTIDDEPATLLSLEFKLYKFVADAWVRTHDDLSIGDLDDFYEWWKNTDKSEWHEQVKSWLKKVMGKFYDEYDIERRFQEGDDPLFEMKIYMSVLHDSVKFFYFGGFMDYKDFLNPISSYYDAGRMYLSVHKDLSYRKRKMEKKSTV